MQFNYVMSRDDYKDHLKEGYFYSSVFYLILFTMFYFIISFNIIWDNFWLVFISYLIYMVVMAIMLYIVNNLFTYLVLKLNDKIVDNYYGEFECQVDDNGIGQKIEEEEYLFKWEDIVKLKQTKKYIMLIFKNEKQMILFRKNLFKDNNQYDELVTIIKENLNKQKENHE